MCAGAPITPYIYIHTEKFINKRLSQMHDTNANIAKFKSN